MAEPRTAEPEAPSPPISPQQATMRLRTLEYRARSLAASSRRTRAESRRVLQETVALHKEIKRLMAVLGIEYVPPPSLRDE